MKWTVTVPLSTDYTKYSVEHFITIPVAGPMLHKRFRVYYGFITLCWQLTLLCLRQYKIYDDVALHLYLIMLDSHTSGQLVRPANQYIVVGQIRAPLHSVGVQLCVKHMQSSRTGPSIHGCRLCSSLENRKHFNVYNVAKRKHMELSLRYLLSQWIKNTH